MNISDKLITSIDRQLLDQIDGEMTVKEVVAITGAPYAKVQMQLARLVQKKALIRVKKGVYKKTNPEVLAELLRMNKIVKERQPTEREEAPDTLVSDALSITDDMKNEIWKMRGMKRSDIANKLNISRLAVSLILDLEGRNKREKNCM
jgi:hypothetical protein